MQSIHSLGGFGKYLITNNAGDVVVQITGGLSLANGLSIGSVPNLRSPFDLIFSGQISQQVSIDTTCIFQNTDDAVLFEFIGGDNSINGIIFSNSSTLGLGEFKFDTSTSSFIFDITNTPELIINSTAIDVFSKQIINVAEPTSNTDAATKLYVDTTASTLVLGDISDLDIIGSSDNDLLYKSGGEWASTNGQVTWDGTTFTVAGALNITTLQFSTDFAGTAPANEDLFLFQDVSNANNQIYGATHEQVRTWIGSLLGAATDNDLLYGSGGEWESTNGQLTWDGTRLGFGNDVGLRRFENGVITVTDGSTGLGAIVSLIPLSEHIGTEYTVQSSDNGKLITLNDSSPITLIIPDGLVVGFNFIVLQLGTGTVTLSMGGSDTLVSVGNETSFASQYAAVSVVKITSSQWSAIGSLGLGTFDVFADIDLTGANDYDLLYRNGTIWVDTGGNLTWNGSQLGFGSDVGLTRSQAGVISVTDGSSSLGSLVSLVKINAQVGTSYELQISDNGLMITLSNALAINLVVPDSLPEGFNVVLVQLGLGQVSVSMSGSDSLLSLGGLVSLSGQYANASLVKISASEWHLFGDLV